jgi:hypothetical protein
VGSFLPDRGSYPGKVIRILATVACLGPCRSLGRMRTPALAFSVRRRGRASIPPTRRLHARQQYRPGRAAPDRFANAAWLLRRSAHCVPYRNLLLARVACLWLAGNRLRIARPRPDRPLKPCKQFPGAGVRPLCPSAPHSFRDVAAVQPSGGGSRGTRFERHDFRALHDPDTGPLAGACFDRTAAANPQNTPEKQALRRVPQILPPPPSRPPQIESEDHDRFSTSADCHELLHPITLLFLGFTMVANHIDFYPALLSHFPDERASVPGPQPWPSRSGWGFHWLGLLRSPGAREAEMPNGETSGAWEDFSTPARDLRLLIAVDVVRGYPDRVARRSDRYAGRIDRRLACRQDREGHRLWACGGPLHRHHRRLYRRLALALTGNPSWLGYRVRHHRRHRWRNSPL